MLNARKTVNKHLVKSVVNCKCVNDIIFIDDTGSISKLSSQFQECIQYETIA